VAREKPVQGADTNRSAPITASDKRHVGLFGHQFADECARASIRASAGLRRWFGNSLSMLSCQLPPADRARYADPKATRRRAATQAAVNRGNNPVPKIL
jgi:hypothetical protein